MSLLVYLSFLEGGYTVRRLQQVTVPVLSDLQCSDLVYDGYQPYTMLCAGLIAGGKDACQVSLKACRTKGRILLDFLSD